MERDAMKLDYISARGDRLPLAHNDLFVVTNIDGMTLSAADISSSTIGTADGDIVNNVQATPRSIVIDLRIKDGVNVEEAKRSVLRVVKIKQRGTLEWTQNKRTVAISGIVENIEMPRWTNATTMQLTLYCSQPFWEDVEAVVQQISEAINLHYFEDNATGMLYFPEAGIPFGEYDTIRTKHFHNSGDVAVGLEISIVALADVFDPIIYDGNGNFFGLGYVQEIPSKVPNAPSRYFHKPFYMKAGDNVIITTHKGNKTVRLNGQMVYDYIKPQSTWLQMEAGDNTFTINSDDDNISNMTFSLTYKQRYV
jgi:hypothetical protein